MRVREDEALVAKWPRLGIFSQVVAPYLRVLYRAQKFVSGRNADLTGWIHRSLAHSCMKCLYVTRISSIRKKDHSYYFDA